MSNIKSSPKIKILVACHDDSVFTPSSDSLAPIQVGAALSTSHFANMLHDDEGENISEKNFQYCELTALYWAWKNLKAEDADYIGLFHYRRYMSFAETVFPMNYFGDVLMERLDSETVDELNLSDESIAKAVGEYDVVTTTKGKFVGSPTMQEQWNDSWQNNPKDMVILREIVSRKSPDMLETFDKYMNSREGYFCNMFIMRRKLFDNYCEWMFGILEEHETLADYSAYDVVQSRVSGYLAERLTGVYISHLQEQGLKVKEVQRAFFEDASKPQELKPCFDDGATTIVLASDNHYVPYLSALLQSIKDTSTSQHDYDIIVLTRDISNSNQVALKQQIEQINVSLRFYDVSHQMRDYTEALDLRGHFQIETYYRLLMQDIFADWDKVLYLDSDMIVKRDVAELFATDIEGYLLGAVLDADTAGLYNGYNPQMKTYMDDELGIANPYGYFQAGTILFNLKEFRKGFDTAEIFAFATSKNWKLLDQDVLNCIAQGYVKPIPMEWNVMTDWRGIRVKDIIARAPKWMHDEYMEARKHPAIIHYAGPEKPWIDPGSDMAHAFWESSRKTPFYEIALKRMAESSAGSSGIKAILKGGIPDDAWERLYPIYQKIFPDRTRRREVMAHIYRRLIVGKKR